MAQYYAFVRVVPTKRSFKPISLWSTVLFVATMLSVSGLVAACAQGGAPSPEAVLNGTSTGVATASTAATAVQTNNPNDKGLCAYVAVGGPCLVTPQMVKLDASGQTLVKDLVWTTWDSRHAVGSGTYVPSDSAAQRTAIAGVTLTLDAPSEFMFNRYSLTAPDRTQLRHGILPPSP